MGPIDTARNPSAAIAARYPAAREQVALADRNAMPSDAVVPTQGNARPTGYQRREGILARAIRTGDLALSAPRSHSRTPSLIYGTDRRGRTALHMIADLGQPALAIALLAARAVVNARDRDGYTPVDTAEYWDARSPRRALDCLAHATCLLLP